MIRLFATADGAIDASSITTSLAAVPVQLHHELLVGCSTSTPEYYSHEFGSLSGPFFKYPENWTLALDLKMWIDNDLELFTPDSVFRERAIYHP
jgi:hypothetical protein